VKIALISLSNQGAQTATRLAEHLGDCDLYLFTAVIYPPAGFPPAGFKPAGGYPEVRRFERICDLTKELFQTCRGLIFIAPTGVAVRAIAPCLRDKRTDPAVVVVDAGGRWAISLLSGHEGGANDLALSVSNILAAEPVITTTTEAVKTIIVGVGCRRGTPAEQIIDAIRQALATASASIEQVRLLASADIKRDEAGLLEASRRLGIPLRLVSSDEIRQSTRDFERSDFVQEKLNLPAVAEPAALLAGRRTRLLLPKQVFPSVTVALAEESSLPKVSHLREGTSEGLAPTCIPSRRSETFGRGDGHFGKLYVVGIGPGGPLDRTRRAEAAIAESQVVVGYHRYLRLIADLTPGKELISSGMKEEVARCRAAIERARAGQTVSLVSSGDAGIYGMAGLAIELAHAEGAKLDDPPAGLEPAGGHPPSPPAGFNPAGGYSIEIIPGVTAASAAAARLGAPLMLDFAAISLSDLLVPWDVILGRLKAMAAADLVVALYNPKSSQRVKQFQEAIAIFRQHRPAETPVGLAAAVGTEEERLTLSTLQKVLDEEVDMRTVVIIGNSMSKVVDGWFVTSRGYAL